MPDVLFLEEKIESSSPVDILRFSEISIMSHFLTLKRLWQNGMNMETADVLE